MTSTSTERPTWRSEITAAKLVPSLAIAVMQTGAAVSLAALVFADAAADQLATGASTFLLGSAIASIVLALRSSFEVVVAGARNNVTVVIAAVGAGVAANAAEQPGPTVGAFVMIAAITSGLLLYLIGRFGLGHLVRFVPFPVMGGYVAGTAWLMVKGGLQVMSNITLTLDNVSGLLDADHLQLWLPGVALACLIVFIPGSNRQSMVILAALVGFHAMIRIVSSPAQVQADGWVIGPFAGSSGVNLFGPADLQLVDWSAITNAIPGLAAVALLALTAAMLNVSGVEFASGEDIDIDHELRASGAASSLSGLAGGTVGFVALGPTLLARQLQASSRLVTAAFVALAAITIGAGPALVGWMPRFVAGALIMGPGIALLRRWVTESMLTGPISDRVIALLIPLTIASIGVLEGIGLGILVAAGLFIWRYASIDPVRSATTGFALRSSVDRSPADDTVLDQHRSQIAVLRLEGFLFFGTAARLNERVVAILAERPETQHVVLDFQRVSGVDSSARAELTKLVRRCSDQSAQVHLSAMPSDLLESFDGHPMADLAVIDLDRALEQAEQIIISTHGSEATEATVQDLTPEILSHFQPGSVAQGTALLATGHPSTSLYLIDSGTLTVWADAPQGRTRIRQVGSGAFLGEVGFFAGSRAMATVTADCDCTVLQLDKASFNTMAANHPDRALGLMAHVLAKTTERLVVTNALVRDLND